MRKSPISSLWALDLDSKQTTRLTRDTTYSVGDFTISDDGKWIGFHGISPNRYERNILEQNDNADLYLLEVATGKIERLTNNKDIAEGAVSFSPDSEARRVLCAGRFPVHAPEQAVYVRDVAQRGGQFRKLGGGFDGDVDRRLLVEGRKDDLLQRRDQGDRPAVLALDVATDDGEAAHARAGVAPRDRARIRRAAA